MPALFLLLSLALMTWAARAADDAAFPAHSLIESLSEAHLAAVHEARLRFERERSTAHILPNGIYDDYRAVLNVETDQARWPETLAAARAAGVRVLVFSGRRPVQAAGDETLLLLPGGTDASGTLQVESTGPSFLSASIAYQPLSGKELLDGCQGFSIWRAGKALRSAAEFLLARPGNGRDSGLCAAAFARFPDEFLGAFQTRVDLQPWDSALALRRCSCVADNGAAGANGETAGSHALNFRSVSTHILARALNEKEVRKSLTQGRTYAAHDWLCDPTGFVFGAGSLLGTFVMGDTVPYYFGNVKIGVFTPLAAHIRILREGRIVSEGDGNQLLFETRETGAYRAEAWLKVDGELRPWIFSSPIYLQEPSLASATVLKIPVYAPAPDVIVQKDVPYVQGKKEDEAKHALDVYRPKDPPKSAEKKGLPVLMFVHGGSWRTGDRWQYLPLGNFLAQNNIVAFIPSYRLAPQHKFPAQIEDVAAAFKWVLDHCAEYGGDPERIYIGGHSAGGHLASLLAFDGRYLEALHVPPRTIKGAACFSGVYDLAAIGDSQAAVFGTDKAARRDASPLTHVKPPAPRMLISCCQYDYLSLPQQAKDFYKAVKEAGADAEFLYVPGENHISEMINIVDPGDPTGQALLKFVR